MKKNFLGVGLLTLSALTTITAFSQPTYAQSVTFICAEDSNNVPTTYAQTPDGGVEVFKWVSNFFPPPYTPKQRCEEITQRLNTFQPDHLVSGKVNSYNVICAGTSCDRNGKNILLTLTPSQNPKQMLAQIDANRDGASGAVRALNNGEKRSVTSITKKGDGNVSLNLNQYISNAPKVPMIGFSSNSSTPSSNSNNNSTIIPETSPAPQQSPSKKGTLW